MNREQREASSILHNVHDAEMREASSSSSSSGKDEIVLTPTRQFWRRLFRASPASSTTSSSSSSARRFKRKNRHSHREGDEEKSHSSSGSSSQSGSEESQHSRNREQRVAKYLAIDTITNPISLIANEGDLTFKGTCYDTRDGNNDYEDYYYDDESNADECRDDVRLLHPSSVVFQSHLLHTPKALREPAEEEDRVALLSEHDGLFDNRRGSYNVDSVDPLALTEPAALERLSLLSLQQKLQEQQGKFSFNTNYIPPRKQNNTTELVKTESSQNDAEPALVPLQIEFPSGETKEGVTVTPSPLSQSSSSQASTKKPVASSPPAPLPAPSAEEASPAFEELESPSSALNPLGEETPAFSEIIQDRTQRHKAFYLLRLRNSQKQKKTNTTPRPSVHGDLFTLPEISSEDESSRLSQLSESIASRLRISRSGSGERSGAWTASSKKKHVILEDQVALISAN